MTLDEDWGPNSQVYASWQPKIRSIKAIVHGNCSRCRTPIRAGRRAIAFTGQTGTRLYHLDCAKYLGIRPTT